MGEMSLKNGAGQKRIRLDADGGNAWLGGNGADGDIVLFPSGGDNADGDIVLFPSGGDNSTLNQATIHLDGQGANIWAGGNGSDGDIVLKNGAGQKRIRLDADGGNAWLGGNGADGDIVLFPSGGDNFTWMGNRGISNYQGPIVLKISMY
jgi:hypothetical protein